MGINYEIVEELNCEYCGSDKSLLKIELHGIKSILCKTCHSNSPKL